MMAGPAAPRAPAQQRSSRGAAAKPSSSSSSPSCRGAAQAPRGLAPSSRNRRHACVAPQAFMAPPDAASLEATTSLISGVVTTGCLAAAVYLLSAPQGQQEAQVEEREACPRCEGSGFEPCICRRWSDDDLGCASCAGKLGYMRCTACGGGGRAKALLAYRPVRMDNKGPPPSGRGM